MHRFFYKTYQWLQNRVWLAVFLFVGFLSVCFWISSKITFEEDITQMFPKEALNNEKAQIWQNVRFQDKIAVIFTKKDTASEEDLTAAAQSFLDTVFVADAYIESIQGQTSDEVMENSVAFVHQNVPLYLELSDYDTIAQRITEQGIRQSIKKNLETLTGNAPSFFKEQAVKDPLGLTYLALPHLQQLSVDEHLVFRDGYLFTKDNQHLVLFIQPKLSGSETKENERFTALLNEIKEALNQQQHLVEINYFGSSFVAVANAQQIRTDILTTITLSMSVLMLILMLYYRRIIVPLLIFLPSVFGGLTALAIMYFITDQLSAISISVSAILLGITIDYALHFLTHSKSINDSKRLFKEITRPLFMSSSTTAIAFLCLIFVDAKALNDLGWFAFIAVMASGFFTLLLLPQIYRPKQALTTSGLMDKLAQYPFEKNKILIAFSLVLIIGSVFTFHKVTFDQDLTNINYFPEEQAAAQKLIEPSESETKSLYVINYGTDTDDVLKKAKEIQQSVLKDNKVLGINSISSVVLDRDTQQDRINRWNTFWKNQNLVDIENRLVAISSEMGFVEDTYKGFAANILRDFEPLYLQDYREVNQQLVHEFIAQKNGSIQVTNLVKIPESYRDEFIRSMETVPQTVVIDRQALNEELLGHLVDDFNDLINISFIAVLLILWYFFRRFELVLLAVVPIALTGFITAGIMGALNIPFNIFSSIVCTLIFGHGVDFTIFMTSALQKQYTYGKNEMPVYRTSIILAVLTTILAIGALIFAKHPALRSISSIALIGVCTAVLMTFVLYPILFRFFIENRPKKGLSPVSLRVVSGTLISFAIFGIVGVLVSEIMWVFYLIAPVSKTRKLKLMGRTMSCFQGFILGLSPLVKKKILQKEHFDKKRQTVIISNHTSFLDSLAVGKYNPYLVYLVNEWVVKSPVFGRFVKTAGFYPVKEGAEGSTEHLKERIGTDFSIMVFPEGTRSYSHEIGRFHKGAFYLAQELHLPIQPIVLHGISEVIPKGDFMIFDGHIFNIVEPLIFPEDKQFGTEYAERTKKISRYFKERFAEIRKELEDENYYKQKLFLNYLYKEHEIGLRVKKDFKKHKKAYWELNYLLGIKEKIVHFTTDYGQTDFLLLKHAPSRKILTINAVDEAREVSETSYITKIRWVNYQKEFLLSEKPLGFHTLLCSHQTEISQEILEGFDKIICFLAPNIEPKGMKCILKTDKISIYERE